MTETEDIKVRLWAIVVCGCRCVPVCVFIWLLLWDSTVHTHIVASVCFICAHVSNTLHFASFIVQNHHCVHKCKSGSYTHTAHGLFWKTCSCGSEHHASSPITHNQVCHTRVKYIKILRNSREKNERQEVTRALWSRWTLTVSENCCVCLPFSVSAPDSRRKITGKKGLRFHSDPRNEITNSIITRMLHGSRANRLYWVIYLIFFFFLFLISPFLDGIIPSAGLFITAKHIR